MDSHKPLTFMFVDDDPYMHLGLAQAIAEAGKFNLVKTALNGADALRFAKHNHIDIVLLDIDMPVMDGLTTLLSRAT